VEVFNQELAKDDHSEGAELDLYQKRKDGDLNP
jgi:hypothetical protein